jgi:methionyl-tRNA formyltransferase
MAFFSFRKPNLLTKILNINNMKFSFWGTSNFSISILNELIKNNLVPSLIVTFSPKAYGRKKLIKTNIVEDLAKQHNIEVIYADTMDNQALYDALKLKKIDVGIVASFGKIIPKNILKVFPLGLINVHPSLLPKYRGPSPIQAVFLNNETTTGTSIFILDELMDHGPIIGQISTQILLEDDYESLKEKLTILGSKLIVNLLPQYANHSISIKPQEEYLATYTKKFTFENCHIDWGQPTQTVYNFIRALAHEPGVFCYYEKNSKKTILKIIKAKFIMEPEIHNALTQAHQTEQTGSIFQEQKRFFVKTLDGFLELITVQPDGKIPMPFLNFFNGNKIEKLF